MISEQEYTLIELSRLAQVTPRTVRYYIQQGLLPSPGSGGPSARYDDRHLHRLRLIKQLQRAHLPLAEIRTRLSTLSENDVRDALAGELEPPPSTAVDYIHAVLGTKGRSAAKAAVRAPRAADVSLPPAAVHDPHTLLRPAGAEASGRRAPRVEAPRLGLRWEAPHLADVSPERPTPPGQQESGVEAAPGEARAYASWMDALHDVATVQSPADRPVQPDRSTWERIVLSPDIELHVRRPLSRMQNRALSHLILLARKLFQEEQP